MMKSLETSLEFVTWFGFVRKMKCVVLSWTEDIWGLVAKEGCSHKVSCPTVIEKKPFVVPKVELE
jgi:hypothetical protein